MQSINTIFLLKKGKDLKINTKEADTIWINNRVGEFRKIRYFGDTPRQYRDLTIKSKLCL